MTTIGDGYRFQLGKGVTVLDDGADVGLVTTGYMIKTAKIAAEKLRKQGIRVRLDHHPRLKPFDREMLFDMANKVSCIVTLENHCVSGGLHSLVAEALVAEGAATGGRHRHRPGRLHPHRPRQRPALALPMTSDDVVRMALEQCRDTHPTVGERIASG